LQMPFIGTGEGTEFDRMLHAVVCTSMTGVCAVKNRAVTNLSYLTHCARVVFW
jgi:hypothetical protein